MRKTIALLLCALMLCSGCSVLKEEKGAQELSLVPHKSEHTGYLTIYPTLYYLDETTGRIMSSSAELQVEDWQQSPMLIVQALLASQIDLGFGHVGSKVHVQRVEITSGIANVDLQSDISLSDRQRFSLSVLVANTLIENCGVSYVNVEFSGEPAKIMGVPLGLIERNEGVLSELYQQKQEQIEAQEETYAINIGLYFVEDSSGYLLPEVRSVGVYYESTAREAAEVLCQLAQGARYEETYRSPLQEHIFTQTLRQCTEEELTAFFEYDNHILTIRQAELLFSCEQEQDRGRYLAAIYDTLQCAIPDLRYIYCYWQDQVMRMDQEEARQYLGKMVEIYLPSEDMVSVRQVRRVVSADDALEWRTYIRLIGQGPIETDPDSVISVFPRGLSEEDILSFDVSGDYAVIDFSENFIYSLERLTAQGQVLMVYSIVNTLCSAGPIKSLQFLVNGEYVYSIRGGNLSLVSPLLPSPGLIKR